MEKAHIILARFEKKLKYLTQHNRRTTVEEAKITNEKRFERLASRTKKVSQFLAAATLFVLAYNLVIWLMTVGVGDWRKFLLVASVLLVGIGFAFLIIVAIIKIFDTEMAERFKRKLLSVISKSFEKIAEAWNFLNDRYCPIVKWDK